MIDENDFNLSKTLIVE